MPYLTRKVELWHPGAGYQDSQDTSSTFTSLGTDFDPLGVPHCEIFPEPGILPEMAELLSAVISHIAKAMSRLRLIQFAFDLSLDCKIGSAMLSPFIGYTPLPSLSPTYVKSFSSYPSHSKSLGYSLSTAF